MSTDYPEQHASPRSLAGATILQIVPALCDEPVSRTAVNVAHASNLRDGSEMHAGAEGMLWTAMVGFVLKRMLST